MKRLTDEKIWNILEQHWVKEHGEKDFGDAYSLEDAQVVAQAQLEADMEELEREYDKPTEAGLWIYKHHVPDCTPRRELCDIWVDSEKQLNCNVFGEIYDNGFIYLYQEHELSKYDLAKFPQQYVTWLKVYIPHGGK